MNALDTPDPPDALAPARLGPVQLRNRVIKAATYEGLTRDSLVTEELIEFHRRPARGGVGMTTVAYCAVAPEGRTERHQLYWRAEALPGLRRLTDAVHADGAAVSAQIGHAGPVADPKSKDRITALLTSAASFSHSTSACFHEDQPTLPRSSREGDAARMPLRRAMAVRAAALTRWRFTWATTT